MDEQLKRVREDLEPSWDELREMRVLSKVLGDLKEEPAPNFRLAPPPRLNWRLPTGIAVALAAAASVWLVLGRASPSQTLAQDPGPSSAGAELTHAAPAGTSELRFGKGTVAWLASGAKVETLEQSASKIELEQRSGDVHYEVDPARGYLFRVRVDQVVIEVVGTSFSVNVQENAIEIAVAHGEVNVVDDERTVRLLPGENARLSRTRVAKDAATTASPAVSGSEGAADVPPSPERESAAALLRRSDAARKRASWGEAEHLLLRVVTEHPQDPQLATTWFLLAKVRKASGRHALAASDFARVQRLAPGGSLAEDALFEEALAREQAGDVSSAQARARLYLNRYPTGPHAARLGKMLPQ